MDSIKRVFWGVVFGSLLVAMIFVATGCAVYPVSVSAEGPRLLSHRTLSVRNGFQDYYLKSVMAGGKVLIREMAPGQYQAIAFPFGGRYEVTANVVTSSGKFVGVVSETAYFGGRRNCFGSGCGGDYDETIIFSSRSRIR